MAAPAAAARRRPSPWRHGAAVDGMASGQEPGLLSGRLARDALVLCHKECLSARTGPYGERVMRSQGTMIVDSE